MGKGYTHMTVIPAYCSRCDLAFQPSAGISVAPGVKGTRIHNSTINCPQCGHQARMLDGVFNVDNDGRIEMLSGMPPITRRMLEHFELLTRRAIRYNFSLPEYAIKASRIHPTFLDVVNKAAKLLKSKASMFSVGCLVLVSLGNCASNYVDVNIDGTANIKIQGELKFEAEVSADKIIEKMKSSSKEVLNQIEKDNPRTETNASAKASSEENP